MNAAAKVELHLHLDCCMSYECVRELRPGVDLRSYRAGFVAGAKCTNLADFLMRPARMVELMQTPAALRLVTRDLFEQLVRDGVVYAEVRFAPLLHTAGGMAPREVLGEVEEAIAAASAATGVAARVIVCTLRHFTPEQSLETARLACLARSRGIVVALDIAGDEAGFPLDAHEAAFALAHRHGLRLTAHAGEAAGPESVRETLRRLKPQRIGHGVRSIEDDGLVSHLIEHDIHLEVCPTSNVQTMGDRVRDYAEHPVDALYRRGVPLSISTDARTVCDVTLASEYEQLGRVFGWSDTDLVACNAAAARAAFAPETLKRRLLSRIEARDTTGAAAG